MKSKLRIWILALIVMGIVFLSGCDTGDKTAAQRLAEGNYEDTTTDHQVPLDLNSLDQNIEVLVNAGNMVGARHYDELEAAVDILEKNGEDVSVLRQKLARLNVAPRLGKEKETNVEPIEQPERPEPVEQPLELPPGFYEFEKNIDLLLNQGHGIGNDVYDPLLDKFKAFETQDIPTVDLDRVRQKLADLTPAPKPVVQEFPFELWAAVEEELNNAIRNDLTFTEEQQDKVRQDIASLEAQGVEENLIKIVNDKLQRVITGFVAGASVFDQELRDKLPECTGNEVYTTTPVDLSQIFEITPLGNIGPPGHTLPTNHMYLHVSGGGESKKIIDLRIPADAYITSVNIDGYEIEGVRPEYSIDFSLCKDLHGYFNHVKAITDELQAVIDEIECEDYLVKAVGSCEKKLFLQIGAGTQIGGVGYIQGNFDFGSYDLRKILDFANPDRHGVESRSIVCPIDLFENSQQFYDKIKRTQGNRCGEVMQDVKGTLQGDWFTGRGTFQRQEGWKGLLAFVHSNNDPSRAIISIGGVISDPAAWEFSEKDSGLFKRKFIDVTADGNIYCYEAEDTGKMTDTTPTGKIIVQMTSDTELKIEHQTGRCPGNFDSPTVYNR